MKNRGKLWIYSLLFLLLVGTMILCISEFLHSEENQGFQRQHQEEQIAEWFLQDVRERAEGTSSEERAEEPWWYCRTHRKKYHNWQGISFRRER